MLAVVTLHIGPLDVRVRHHVVPFNVRDAFAGSEPVVDHLPHGVRVLVLNFGLRLFGQGESVALVVVLGWQTYIVISQWLKLLVPSICLLHIGWLIHGHVIDWLETWLRGVRFGGTHFDCLESFLLNELVHPVESLVVFLKTGGLFLGQDKGLFLHIHHSRQVVDISLKFAVLVLHLFAKLLGVLEISFECHNFTVPKVQLILM